MTKDSCIKSKDLLEPLVGLFALNFHFQRKSFLKSLALENPEYYIKVLEPVLLYQYEKIFGFEFLPGESYQHFDNAGISLSAEYVSGYTRTQNCQRLVDPSVSFNYGFFIESPYSIEVTVKEASRYSKMRRNVFFSTTPIDDHLLEYVNPRLLYKKAKVKKSTGAFPYWVDLKLFMKYGCHSGTLTSGLTYDDIHKSVYMYKFAADPFRTYATGGYKILTTDRSVRGPSEESLDLASAFERWEGFGLMRAHRVDNPISYGVWDHETFGTYYYVEKYGAYYPPPWRINRAKRVRSSVYTESVHKKSRKVRNPVNEEESNKMYFFKASGHPTSLTSAVSTAVSEVDFPRSEEEDLDRKSVV